MLTSGNLNADGSETCAHARLAISDNAPVRRRLLVLGALAIVVIIAGTTYAQRNALLPSYTDDVEYDGRITFVRLRWKGGSRFDGGWSSAWNHDYPRAEQHLSQILRELTYVDIRLDGSRILTLDDPELFRYPIAYMWEPGFWTLSDTEAAALGAYLRKGGTAIFEDFDGPSQWANFEEQMRRVLPEGHFARIDRTHRVFDSFFTIHDIDSIVHPMSGIKPAYLGIFEDNDPAKRLMVIANFENDVPEYWEWSGQGLFPFATSSEAYKLGVNDIIYGLTH
jgi:hypothetical protein